MPAIGNGRKKAQKAQKRAVHFDLALEPGNHVVALGKTKHERAVHFEDGAIPAFAERDDALDDEIRHR